MPLLNMSSLSTILTVAYTGLRVVSFLVHRNISNQSRVQTSCIGSRSWHNFRRRSAGLMEGYTDGRFFDKPLVTFRGGCEMEHLHKSDFHNVC